MAADTHQQRTAHRSQTRHVLIIDDDDDIREVTEVALSRVAGWQVSQASNGCQGVATAAELVPDAILLDVMMPDLDGPQTVQRLRDNAATREIPIIMLTAKSSPSDGADPQVAGVIPKPFDPMTLADQVRALLGWS